MKTKYFRKLKAPNGKIRVICINVYRNIRYLLGDYKYRRNAIKAAGRKFSKTDNCYYAYNDQGVSDARFIQPANPQPK